MEPRFIYIADRVIAVHEIKWAGMQKRPDSDQRDLYIEFIHGGWTNIKDATVEDLKKALNNL